VVCEPASLLLTLAACFPNHPQNLYVERLLDRHRYFHAHSLRVVVAFVWSIRIDLDWFVSNLPMGMLLKQQASNIVLSF
jgi:hypothetical protein